MTSFYLSQPRADPEVASASGNANSKTAETLLRYKICYSTFKKSMAQDLTRQLEMKIKQRKNFKYIDWPQKWAQYSNFLAPSPLNHKHWKNRGKKAGINQ